MMKKINLLNFQGMSNKIRSIYVPGFITANGASTEMSVRIWAIED